MTFSGTYKFRSSATINSLDFAFLYTKLQAEDRDFVFTGGTTSWKRVDTPGYNLGSINVQICIEIPEPIGIYETEEDAINDTKRPGVQDNILPPPIPVGRLATLFYIVRGTGDSIPFLNIFKIEGLSTYPNAEQFPVDSNFYGFWEDNPNFPGIMLGIAPTHKPEDCPLLKMQTVPDAITKIGFSLPLSPYWKNENYDFSPPTSNVLSRETFYEEAYGSLPIIPVDWLNASNFSFSCHSRLRIYLHEALIDPALLACGSTINTDSWYLAQPHKWQSYFPNSPGSTEPSKSGFFAVQCDINQKNVVEAFLNQVLDYWEIPGTLEFVRGCTAGGCNLDENGTEYPPSPPDPVNPVYSARFKGRYSEVFLNYQSKGEVKELKLPIEFPTRATKVQLIPPAPVEHYHANIPIVDGWRATEQPLVSEAFTGRLSMDKDNIYVSILYGTIRDWEIGKPLPNDVGVGEEFGDLKDYIRWFPQRQKNPLIGDGFLVYGGFDGIDKARPLIDRWKYCKTFVVNKKSFTITSETLKTYPEPLVDTNQFIIDYTILKQQKTPRYLNYANGVGASSRLSLIQLDALDYGFTGNPVCYPQIAGTIKGEWFVNDSDNRQFPIETIPDFLKPQTLWNQKDWLFWNLLEKPRKPLTNTSYFRFELENKFGGHGRSSIVPERFFIILESHPISGWRPTSENYFGEVVESERFRGSPVLNTENKIVKWLRISPCSYPYFEPGVSLADSQTTIP